MRHRISWADTAKALGMLLVFWGHLLDSDSTADSVLSNAIRYIYAFHMPLFFILAGYFYRPQNMRFGSLLINKFKTRLIPVIFFDAITVPFWQHPQAWGITNVDPATVHTYIWFLAKGVPNLNWPCWFLVCLFSVELFASEIIPALTTRIRVIAAILLAYCAGRLLTDDYVGTAVTLGISNPWWFAQEVPIALSFYLLGYAFSQYGEHLLPKRDYKTLLIGFVALLFWLFAGSKNFATGGHANMSAASHGDWLLFPLAAISGSLLFIYLCSYIPANALLKYIGNNTLPLLGLNGFFVHFFNVKIFGWCSSFGSGLPLLGLTLCIAAASLLATLPLVYLLNRLLPYLVGKWR
jgi:fucose 4-O-acetylase-like acetyltransferase